jgi:cytochrome b subunit of formate dehydrogenase
MRNYWVDVVMGLMALTLGVSALLLWVVLPQGYFASRLLWLGIHKWTGLALSVTVLLHVLLHGRWLVRTTKRVVRRCSERDLTRFLEHRSDPEWL